MLVAFLALDVAVVAWLVRNRETTKTPSAVDTAPHDRAMPRPRVAEAPAPDQAHPPQLTARVADENGQPLAGAMVEVRRDGKVVATNTTGDDGVVSFGDAPPRPFEVEARVPGRGGHIWPVD